MTKSSVYIAYFICILLMPLHLYAQNDTIAVVVPDSIPSEVERQQKREEMRIHFRVAKTNIDKSYMDNEEALQRIIEWVDETQKDSLVDIVAIEFCGACSPEGNVPFNRYLSRTRLSRLENYVRRRIDIPEDIITRSDHYIAWSELEEMVALSDIDNKDRILDILRSENRSKGDRLDSRIGQLKALDNGKTWRKLFNLYFSNLRNAYMVIVTEESDLAIELKRPRPEKCTPDTMTYVVVPDLNDVPKFDLHIPIETPSPKNMYVKTNATGLGLLIANAGVEFDLGNYFSVSIPIYYSALNYFTSTVKFRTLAFQPEFRVWPLKNQDRLFIGLHMGLAYYNFAFGGKWRYQDHEGRTPTLGGGLSIGYRLPISKDKNWKLELGIGAGVYPLHYDVFYNTDKTVDGELYDTRKKTYFGIDNVLIGISYRIPLKKTKPAIVY